MNIKDRIQGLPEELEKPMLIAYSLFGKEVNKRFDNFIDKMLTSGYGTALQESLDEMEWKDLLLFHEQLNQRLNQLNIQNSNFVEKQRQIIKDIIKGAAILLVEETELDEDMKMVRDDNESD